MVNILFLSYWGIEDGLTKATVIPHIEILAQNEKSHKIVLCTIERLETKKPIDLSIQKAEHVPLNSKWKHFRFLNKVFDFLAFPSIIGRIIRDDQIHLIIARGAPAGAMIYGVSKKNNLPLVVESFEPHAEYMLESGIWKKNSLSYLIENYFEKKVTYQATKIVTVSKKFQDYLQKKVDLKERITLAPCSVHAENFKFSPQKRLEIREQLNLTTELTGIYVGKFGDLYLQDDAFEIFQAIFQSHKGFQLIILSPMPAEEINKQLLKFNLNINNVQILKIDHSEVPNYLSAADFAFALYKSGTSKMGLSPIKIGEYWANGLPVFITPGIGDDSDIISENKIGEIIDLKNIDTSVSAFLELVESKTREEWNKEIAPFAKKYRSFEIVKKVYDEILEGF